MSFFKRLWTTSEPEPEARSKTDADFDPERIVAAEAPAERRQRKRLNAQRGLSALIIDDSPTILAALSKTLQSAGYVTHEALSAEDGLEKIAAVRPSLIFLDIVLPGMNGFAALRLIRRDPISQNIPVIMISGNEHATEQFYANRIGADDFMKKPFSRFEVFSRIEGLLDTQFIPRRKGGTTRPGAVMIPSDTVAADSTVADAAMPANVASSEATPIAADMNAPSASTPAAPGIPDAMTALEARKELTAMGLQYFDQAQYAAAVRRNDTLAVALFVRGGGIVGNPDEASPSVLALAQFKGQAALAAIRKQSGE